MSTAPEEIGLGPAAYFADERLRALIGPGAPFEVEPIVLDGVSLRSFIRAPKTIIDTFRMSIAHEALDHLVFEDERLTFADVRRTALALAGGLSADLGVRQGTGWRSPCGTIPSSSRRSGGRLYSGRSSFR